MHWIGKAVNGVETSGRGVALLVPKLKHTGKSAMRKNYLEPDTWIQDVVITRSM